jgi:hypothetical protein
VDVYSSLSWFVCVFVRAHTLAIEGFGCVGGSNAGMDQRNLLSSVLLVAADIDSCGGVGHFHLVLPQGKQLSPQLKANQTAKSLPGK